MSFTLEVVKGGKDRILYNNSKYREHYSIKSGDIVWRCLGRTCKASIKTNKEKTAIYEAVDSHSGPHPVTMRPSTPSTPVSLQQKNRLQPHTPIMKSTPLSVETNSVPSGEYYTPNLNNTVHVTSKTTQNTLTTLTDQNETEITPSENQRQSLTELLSPYITLRPEPPTFTNVEEENVYLRQRVAELAYTNNALTDKLISLEKHIMELHETAEQLSTSSLTSMPNDTMENMQTDTTTRKTTLVNASSQTDTFAIVALEGVHVLEADMGDVMDEWRSSSAVAFAHTISGDFGHPRQMSAGVAVTFKKRFGKPQPTNCITKSLAYQRTDDEAAVYSLITKQHFNGKPSTYDYNQAFDDLIDDFKKRGFKTLVCSPMGCVRDLIELDHFASKINQFHENTGATVIIVTRDQQANRVLRHGLSHPEFVKQLKSKLKKNSCNTNEWYKLSDEDMKLYIDKLSIPTNALVLEPTISHFIKSSESTEDTRNMLKDIAADTFEYIIAPVNDRSDETAEGGGHWSLLVYARETDTFFHLDSLDPMNRSHADRLAAKLSGVTPTSVEQLRCCRQEKYVECGVYVLHYIQMLCSRIKNNLPIRDDRCFLSKPLVNRIYCNLRHYKLNQPKEKTAKQKITLLSDSHGRGLRRLLQTRLGDNCDVLSIVKPNATLENVAGGLDQEISGLKGSDHLVILGGTNNVDFRDDYDVKPFVKEIASKTVDTNVILCTVPLRYDKPNLNSKIRKINIDLVIEALKYEHIKVISLSNISAKQYTTQGLHLNYKGKQSLTKLVSEKILFNGLN